MRRRFQPLSAFSPRALDLVARFADAGDASVHLSSRVDAPAYVCLDRRQVILDEDRCGIEELLVFARLLAQRARRRHIVFQPPDDAVSPETVRSWVADAVAHLDALYPGLFGGDVGRRTALADMPLPRVVRNGARFRVLEEGALDRAALSLAGGLDTFGAEIEVIPGDHEGLSLDMEHLLARIDRGSFPSEERPELPGVRFARVPLRVQTGAGDAGSEARMQRYLDGLEDGAQSYARCIRRRSEGVVRPWRTYDYRRRGTRIDPRRLVVAHVASLLGRPERIFERKEDVTENVFDARDHLAIVALDAGSFIGGGKLWGSHESRHFALGVTRAFQILGIETMLMSFADRLVTLPSGRRALLHLPTVTKGLDEDLTRTTWTRVWYALDLAKALPGDPFCCPVFHFDAVASALEQAARAARAKHLHVVYLGMREAPAPFDHEERQAEWAGRIDDRLSGLHASLGGVWHGFSHVSRALVDAARKGGIVADMEGETWERDSE